jgi:hypothetical protein
MPDSRDQMIATILTRYRQLCADHDTAQQNVERMQQHQLGLMAQINDCFAAARLFGFDLVAEFQHEAKGDPSQLPLQAPEPIIPPLFPVGATPTPRRERKVKDLVLDAVAAAFPLPAKVADIRRDLASKGITIHQKTVGMSLWRWLQHGCVRREGQSWYFVPPENRAVAKVNGHRHKLALSSADMLPASA